MLEIYEFLIYILFVRLIELCSLLLSMTTTADLNDKWATYAGPGGWNGKNEIFVNVIT